MMNFMNFGGGGMPMMPMMNCRSTGMSGGMGQSLHTNPFAGYTSNMTGQHHYQQPRSQQLRHGGQGHDTFQNSHTHPHGTQHAHGDYHMTRTGHRGNGRMHAERSMSSTKHQMNTPHGWQKMNSAELHRSGMQQVQHNGQRRQYANGNDSYQNGSPTYAQRMQQLNHHFTNFLSQSYPGLSIPEAAQSFHQNFYQPFQQRVGQYVNQFSNAVQQFPTQLGAGFGNLTNAVYGALGLQQANTIPGYAEAYQLGAQGLGGFNGGLNMQPLGFGGQQQFATNPFGSYNQYQNAIIPPIVSGSIQPATSTLQGVPQIPNIGQLM